MPYALVKDSTGEVLQLGPGKYPGLIPQGVTSHEVGDDVVAGMFRQKDGRFVNPTPPEEKETPEGLKAYAAAKRYEAEIGGITVGGNAIATDRESQQLINSAMNYAALNSSLTLQFKTNDGEFIPLDAAAVQNVALAVAAHVQACFAKEAEAVERIDVGSIKSRAEIDAFFSLTNP